MALLKRPAAVSPERIALAAAIKAHAEYMTGRDAVHAGVQPAWDQWGVAMRAVDAAETALGDAPAAFERYLKDKAQGKAGDRPLSIREAREALADAQYAAAAAEAARKALQAEADKPVNLSMTASKLRDAGEAVLRAEALPAAQAVAAEVVRLQNEMVARFHLLDLLARSGVFPVVTEHGATHGQPADPAVRAALFRVHSQQAVTTWDIWDKHKNAADAWRTALAALETDANTSLPSLTAIASAS